MYPVPKYAPKSESIRSRSWMILLQKSNSSNAIVLLIVLKTIKMSDFDASEFDDFSKFEVHEERSTIRRRIILHKEFIESYKGTMQFCHF